MKRVSARGGGGLIQTEVWCAWKDFRSSGLGIIIRVIWFIITITRGDCSQFAPMAWSNFIPAAVTHVSLLEIGCLCIKKCQRRYI